MFLDLGFGLGLKLAFHNKVIIVKMLHFGDGMS